MALTDNREVHLVWIGALAFFGAKLLQSLLANWLNVNFTLG